MKHMTRQLIHLVAVIDNGSLSRAADALNLTQSALTRSINSLEEEVKSKVLERGRQGAKPTKIGETLYIHGKNIITSLDRADADVQALHQHDSGKLFIGSTSLPAVYFVPKVISLFLKKHPNVGMRFEVYPVAELETMLRHGAIDMFLGSRSTERLPEGIETTTLHDERLAVICGPQHPLVKKTKLEYADFAEFPWLLPTKETALRQQAEVAFQELGLTNIHVAIETLATASLTPLLGDENYLTFHSKYLLAPDIKEGKLCVLMDNVPGARRALTAYHGAGTEMPALVREFLDHMKECAKTSIV
jgi:DNA-binding transcriptional LysR family regulator